MNVGDLVRLSAYGKQLRRSAWIKHDEVGIIVRKIDNFPGTYDPTYRVQWVKSDYKKRRKVYYWDARRDNDRKDLKYAR